MPFEAKRILTRAACATLITTTSLIPGDTPSFFYHGAELSTLPPASCDPSLIWILPGLLDEALEECAHRTTVEVANLPLLEQFLRSPDISENARDTMTTTLSIVRTAHREGKIRWYQSKWDDHTLSYVKGPNTKPNEEDYDQFQMTVVLPIKQGKAMADTLDADMHELFHVRRGYERFKNKEAHNVAVIDEIEEKSAQYYGHLINGVAQKNGFVSKWSERSRKAYRWDGPKSVLYLDSKGIGPDSRLYELIYKINSGEKVYISILQDFLTHSSYDREVVIELISNGWMSPDFLAIEINNRH